MTFREWFRGAAPGILLLFGIGTFWLVGYSSVWQRYQLDVQGTVTARQDFPRNKYNHGPTSRYTLKQGDGSIREYTTALGDAALSRTIPVGVHIAKRKGELFYFLNDRRVDDFPLMASLIALGVAIAFMIGAGFLLARERWTRARRFAG